MKRNPNNQPKHNPPPAQASVGQICNYNNNYYGDQVCIPVNNQGK